MKPIHVVNKDPKELIKIFVKTLVQVAKQAYKINTKIYKDIYKQIDNLTDHKKKCFQTFDKWIREVPVIGFNSGKSDCNIMKTYLYDMLFKYDNNNQNIQALKTGNC